MVQTAKEWGWSPTALIRGAKNPREHHPADYNFALAVKTLLDQKCPQCGVPIWYAFTSHTEVGFKLKTVKCHACIHKATKTKDQEQKPGVSHIVYAVPADDAEELPPRKDYFEREMKAHQLAHQRELERKAKEYQ